MVVCVLFTAGDHVPGMPSLDCAGKLMVPPLHTGAMGSNVGVSFGLTVTCKVVVVAHSPGSGVKV